MSDYGVYFALFDDDRIKVGQSGYVTQRLSNLANQLGTVPLLIGLIPIEGRQERIRMERRVLAEMRPFKIATSPCRRPSKRCCASWSC